jgi:hypothetical protein
VVGERSELPDFLVYLRQRKDFEPHRGLIRVTPGGLFIESTIVERVVELYQAWFAEFTKGEASRTIEKSRQRLLGPNPDEKFYLIEGKNTLHGVCAPGEIQAPQSSGLPYNLGALLSAKKYLHPSDPVLAGIVGLVIRNSQQGVEFSLKARGKECLVPAAVLRDFEMMIAHSPYLQRRHEGIGDSQGLRVAVLAKIIAQSRPIPENQPMLIPHRFSQRRDVSFQLNRKMLVAFQKTSVVDVIELNGRNLSGFLKHELGTGPKDVLGAFRLAHRREPNLGSLKLKEGEVVVRPLAFAEFVEVMARSTDPKEKFNRFFTAQDCFQRFSSLLQLSQPIERIKLARVLDDRGVRSHYVRVNGNWVFGISRRGVLERVVARHIRSHRRSRRDEHSEQ